jgi:hypothetical protein
MTERKEVKPLKARPAPPDDPIYTRGYVLGRVGRPLQPVPQKRKGKDDD